MILVVFLPEFLLAQEAPEKPTLSLNVKYFNDNNKTHHLWAQAKSKIDGKFQMIENVPLKFYISTDDHKNNLLGQAVTNGKGEALLVIPASAREQWMKSPNQTFIVISLATKKFEATNGELAVTKAKIQIDTTEGKMITAKLVALVDTVWTPIAGVDMIVGVKRLGGILNANETPTYTSDSSGGVIAEYKRDSLPGDEKGNVVLIASVLDNDTYGNLTAEMTAPWGKYYPYVSRFDDRTLFARRGHSPIWLEVLAYAIVIAVWAIILFLLIQIKNIKKLGVE
jgi:hypothetical protein